MNLASQDIRFAVRGATTTAAAMIAFQVGAKATRDAFFLTIYPVTLLPAMMAVTSVLAVALAYVSTRLLTRWGPDRVVPAAFAGSAILLLLEWTISLASPRIAAVLLYLHYGCLGGLLVSGFWSFVNERFDPRTAKRQLGGIMAAGSVGGLAGGLIATQVGRVLPVTAMIPILAVLHLVCALSTLRLRTVPGAAPEPASRRGHEMEQSDVRALARTPYIRGLIALVLLVTISEGLIDLVLKGRAATALGNGGVLLQFFAAFYAGVSLLTVIVQAIASRVALTKLGPARTAAILPAGAAAAAAGAILVPGLSTAVVARGLESVLSNSLYRGGYEILFTPVPAREKRAIKALADVGASRLGDLVAAGIAQIVVLVSLANAGHALLGAALALSLLAVVVALRLHAGYVQTLARGLVSQVVQLDMTDVQDSLTRLTVLQTLGPRALSQILEPPKEEIPAPGPPTRPGGLTGTASPIEMQAINQESAELRRIREFHSPDSARVVRALQDGPPSASVVPHIVRLLAWDDVAREAIAALRAVGPDRAGATEHLIQHLLDPREDFTIRRRIPLVLATYGTPRALQGLMSGLEDQRFEVRYRCGRGLAHMLDLDASLSVPREKALAAVIREVKVGAGVWESRKLEPMEDEGWSPVVDELLKDRADRSLEHVFTLLALVLPRRPLRLAFQGLHTSDPLLRGTALEYLESTLPSEIRRPLWPYLEDTRPRHPAPARSKEQVLQDLLHSSESIAIKLEELRHRGHQS